MGITLAMSFIMVATLVPAMPASAQQTSPELQAQIQVLLAQIAALQAQIANTNQSTGACFTFTRNHSNGDSGGEVMQIQQFLNSHGAQVAASGAGSPGNETSYFGALTQAAVSSFQAANGITPTAGYWGPITRARANSMCVPTTPGTGTGTPTTPTTPTGLQGGAGSLQDADLVSNLNNEKVGEGARDVEVMGLELEADEGSDIELVAVNLNFSQGTADRRFDRYADEVTIWLDGKKLASVKAKDFDRDRDYGRTVTLKTGGIIRAGDSERLIVAVSGAKNIDSADIGETWTVAIDNIRFRDAQGASITDSSTGDIGETRAFSFETFSSAANVELRAQASNDTPQGIIEVDDNNDTDDVELLRFTLEARGGDIRIRDFPITFATSSGNTADTLAKIAHTIYIEIDGKEWSENVSQAVVGSAGATITFDDVDYMIDEGDKVTIIVRADINDTQAGSFVDGDGLTASFTASNRAMLEAEDKTGEDLAANEKTGTGNGKAVVFYDTGIAVSFVSSSQTVASNSGADDDSGTFIIKYRVEAFDGIVYVSTSPSATTTDSITDATVDSNGILYLVDKAGTATTDDLSSVVTWKKVRGNSTSAANGVRMNEGDIVEFTLSVVRTNNGDATDDGLFRVLLKAIGWNTDNSTTFNVYDFDLEDYKTDPIHLN